MPKSELKTPSYMKIQNYVFEKIRSGEYQLGSKYPPKSNSPRLFPFPVLRRTRQSKRCPSWACWNEFEDAGRLYAPIRACRLYRKRSVRQ